MQSALWISSHITPVTKFAQVWDPGAVMRPNGTQVHPAATRREFGRREVLRARVLNQ